MSITKIAKNIRILRDMRSLSQEQLSESLGINRSRLGAYEEGRNEPPIDLIIKIAGFFQISIDALIRGDLSKTDPEALMKIGKNRILFPVLVDKDNNDVIEVVPIRASAGYLNGYADPQFVEELPVMNLPFKIVGKHRAFAIKGDSMPPLKDGAIIVGKYVESFDEVKDGQTYTVLTKNDGLVYKRLYRAAKKPVQFEFHSDNTYYTPYSVPSEEILEIWSFVCSINMGEFKQQDVNIDSMIKFLQSYRVEMKK